jgi:predicted RNA-binding Zn ribbon-like protein
MADIVIKRKIPLGFLGEEYKEDYLVFSAIPMNEYEKLMDVQSEDSKQATKIILKTLQDKFVEGRFQGQKVETEDIGKFDGTTVVKCFAVLTGQDIDPKE